MMMGDTYMMEKEERNWAMFSHLSTFIGMVLTPLTGLVAALVIWILRKDESYFVDLHGKEAVNFQLSLLIYYTIAGILCFVLIGIPMVVALGVFQIVCTIIASMRANDGMTYRYPFTIRFL